MRLLLDECVPEDLIGLIPGHDVFSVSTMGWKGIKNGELMQRAAENGFSAFLTVDKNLRYQQNISKYPLAIIVFDVTRNTLPYITKSIPALLEILPTIEKATVYVC